MKAKAGKEDDFDFWRLLNKHSGINLLIEAKPLSHLFFFAQNLVFMSLLCLQFAVVVQAVV